MEDPTLEGQLHSTKGGKDNSTGYVPCCALGWGNLQVVVVTGHLPLVKQDDLRLVRNRQLVKMYTLLFHARYLRPMVAQNHQWMLMSPPLQSLDSCWCNEKRPSLLPELADLLSGQSLAPTRSAPT